MKLIDAYLDGELTPETEKEFAAWLAADPENARTFARVTCAHRSTRDLIVTHGIMESVAVEAALGGPRTRRAGLLWTAAAACLLGVAGVLAFPRPEAETPVVVMPDAGRWNLKVNVVPFAEVAILREKTPIAADYTPASLHAGGGDYRVEICWPSRANPRVRLYEDMKDLRDGETVTVAGDISKSAITMVRQ